MFTIEALQGAYPCRLISLAGWLEPTVTNGESAIKSFVRRVTTNETLEDTVSNDRSEIWRSFSSDERKTVRESCAFVKFVKAADLGFDPYDHENPKPPEPDIRTGVSGRPYYWELGEITDEGLARAARLSEKTGEITGGPFSQLEPLTRMLNSKCSKKYETGGSPVDLLLFYSKQYPYIPTLREYLGKRYVVDLLHVSQFSRVWLFSDWPPGRVLWSWSR